MNTHDCGDIGVAKVTADLIVQGWQVLIPISAVSPFDLVAYKDGIFRRIQVKYRTAKNGTLLISCEIQKVSRRKLERRVNDQVDYVAAYCPDNDSCYYISVTGSQGQYNLRIEPTRNNQKNLVRMGSDFRSLL